MSRLERIVAACGGLLLDGGKRALIPGPDHSAKDRSVSLIETEDGRIIIHCFSPRDDWRDVRRALAGKGLLNDDRGAPHPAHLTPPRIVTQPAQEDRLARAKRLWEESKPLAWTVGESYLRGRAIAARPWNESALRFHPRMTSLDDRTRRPALMAALRDANGATQGVQATLLGPHGTAKAAVPTPRRVIGQLIGGAVRLGDAGDALIVAEGVETALSASDAIGLPVWALLSADNLSRFEPPAQVRRLVVAMDNDAAGATAFEALSARLSISIAIDKATPPDGAGDWNDWACDRRGAG
jgi:putative DNA primase/helicase